MNLSNYPYFMPIKPLETKTDWSALFKVLFLITLVATGVLMDKIFLEKNKEIPNVLGNAQEKIVKVGQDRPVQVNNFVNKSITKAEKVSGTILGEATATVNKLTSDAGSFISNIIYENSIGKIVDQIDKLPEDQQKKIKEQICK